MRHADHPIDSLFLRRWSPRAMSGEPIAEATLLQLLEAARWAPSAGNTQPWRFVVAHRDDAAWSSFFGLLEESNAVWCARAAALLVVCAKTTRVDGSGNVQKLGTAHFDTGAAWMALSLQGTLMGLVVHGMGGFDHARARDVVKAPADVDVLCMVAVGVPGDKAHLPEKLQARENPNGREPLATRVVRGAFSAG